MRNETLFAFLFVSLFLPWVVGCDSWGSKSKSIEVPKPDRIPPSGVMTLSQRQLLWLDLHSPDRPGPRVVAKRIAGAGVEYDIRFPNNKVGNRELNFVSSGTGGRGALIGGDTSDFSAFGLKLSLVSINGRSEPGMKEKLVAGALIGPTTTGQLSTYEPVVLSSAEDENSVTARTTCRVDNVQTVGFHLHMQNPHQWSESETKVTILVEPAPDGVPIPWHEPTDEQGQPG